MIVKTLSFRLPIKRIIGWKSSNVPMFGFENEKSNNQQPDSSSTLNESDYLSSSSSRKRKQEKRFKWKFRILKKTKKFFQVILLHTEMRLFCFRNRWDEKKNNNSLKYLLMFEKFRFHNSSFFFRSDLNSSISFGAKSSLEKKKKGKLVSQLLYFLFVQSVCLGKYSGLAEVKKEKNKFRDCIAQKVFLLIFYLSFKKLKSDISQIEACHCLFPSIWRYIYP